MKKQWFFAKKIKFQHKIFLRLFLALFLFSLILGPLLSNKDFVQYLVDRLTVNAATSGVTKFYLHKEPSDKDATYNALTLTPPDPGTDTASSTSSTTNVNATPPTALCESSNNTGETFNKVSAASATTGERCMATFISIPVGTTWNISTGDTTAISASIWTVRSSASIVAIPNIYIYKWDGTTLTRIKTFTGTNTASTTVTQSSFAFAAPDANVTVNATDRIVAIASMNVTTAVAASSMGIQFDSTARAAATITMKYSVVSPNRPSIGGASQDDDFALDKATTACSSAGVAYNTKWTCKNGTATNSTGGLNSEDNTNITITGDSASWLWLANQFTGVGTPSNFGTTPSNTYMYQALPPGAGSGNVTTVMNSSVPYTMGASNPSSPYTHGGLYFWASNTDYLGIQVYATGVKSTTNTVDVAINRNGVLSSVTSLNASTTTGTYGLIWLRFVYTQSAYSYGYYQAQYSTNGTSFTNLGSNTQYSYFTRVGLNSFNAVGAAANTYAAAFEYFTYTLKPQTFNQVSYKFYANSNSTDVGSPLTNVQNSGSYLSSTGTTFRLRMLIRVGGGGLSLSSSGQSFKLQMAATTVPNQPCTATDSGFSDVNTTNSEILFNDNSTPANGAALTANASDPADIDTPGGNTNQTYVESNNFTNSQGLIANNWTGKWDFSLKDNSSSPYKRFCFKIVKSDGTDLDSYNYYPEVTSYGGANAPILVQSTQSIATSSATSFSSTFTGSVTAGDTIIIASSLFNGSGTPVISSITDNKTGNSYSIAKEVSNATGKIAIWYGQVVNGGSSFTVTINVTASSQISIALHEYSGLVTSSLDQTASVASGTGTAATTANTSTTTQANELIFSNFQHFDAGIPSQIYSAPGTVVTQAYLDGTNEPIITSYQYVNSAGAYYGAVNFDKAPSGWMGAVATFKSVSPTFTQSNYRVFNNASSADVGTALAAQNTAATLPTTGAAFRIRALVQVGSAAVNSSGQTFRLQYVGKGSGTCASPSGGSPAFYQDVTTTTSIAFNTVSGVSDGTALTANASDPTAASGSVSNQTVEELNTFTNSLSSIASGNNGKWDFALIDNGAAASAHFCFKITLLDGSDLNTYSQYPEIIAKPSGTLSVDVVDNTSASVSSPSVSMTSKNLSFGCQTSTGTLGTSSQKIRVNNTTITPGWILSIAATSGSTALWNGGTPKFDFNDASGSGCTDGADADTYAGQLTINPATAIIASQGGCTNTGISTPASSAFSEGSVSSITLATAGGTTQTNCYWDFTAISLSQTIPAEQKTGTYTLNMTLTVIAN